MSSVVDSCAKNQGTKKMATPINGNVAATEVFAPLSHGEGPRIGILGDSGCGKTEAMRRLVKEYLRLMPKAPVFVIDDKEARPQFEGQLRRDALDFIKHPPSKEPRVIVFRGDQFSVTQGEVDPEEIAEIQRRMAQQSKRPSLVVYDELDKAANMRMWKRGDASTVRWAFVKGRSRGAATIWGTQETQTVPAEAFNQSSHILCFRMVGNPVRLLRERGYLEGSNVDEVITSLPGDELPPNKRGYFVLLRRGRPWDGKVYRFQ
jgi:hypothetical protein